MQPIQCLSDIAVPYQMLHAVDPLRYRCTSFSSPGFRHQGFGLLLENGHPHCDMEPIDPMLAAGLHVLLHPPDILAAV